ncbi:MAG: type II toxin-antitoxin system RelE/ParE family toxin [Nitrospirae bacterium]|nr:type II toxin-antitoxin system RelE/ParE family toxin [Nitrospirota bacterium]
MYQVETTPEFDQNIQALDQHAAARIIKKIEWLSLHPELLNHPLKYMPNDLKGLQKYRIGSYRVLYWVDHRNGTITLYGVEHRRSVYKKVK